LIFFFSISNICATTIQGRLDRFGQLGISPAYPVTLTLNSFDTGTILKTVTTGSDGIYFFEDCPIGSYILKVWPKGPNDNPLNFRVEIEDQPIMDIAPILMHSLNIEFPTEGERIPAGIIIKAKGTHYSLPKDVFAWIVLKLRNENYFPTKRSLYIKPNGLWNSREFSVVEGTIEMLVVLVTKQGDREFRLRAEAYELEPFYPLPRNSHIIARKKITIN
jgi:hypothetical protein